MFLPARKTVLIGAVLALLAGMAEAAPSHELRIADRYFAQRKAALSRSQLAAGSGAASLSMLELLRPDGFVRGSSWTVRLELIRPPLRSPEVRLSRLSEIRYTVIDWSGFPEAELLLRVEAQEAQGPSVPALHLEHRISFASGKSEFRRCRKGGGCGPWVRVDSSTIRLGGEDAGLGWEHGPVLFPAETLFDARLTQGEAVWESEDFFGRRSIWRWRV